MNCICLFIHEILVECLLWPGAGAIKMNQRLSLLKKKHSPLFVGMFSLVREIKKWRARERRQHNDIPITRTWKSQDVKARISLGGHNANCFPLFPE